MSATTKKLKGHVRVVPVDGSAYARPLDPTRKPWERQPDESPKAFAAFTAYRSLPGDRRSLVAARDNLGEASGSGRTYEAWSAEWSWVDRALAWDDELDRLAREKQIEEVLEMSKRHAQAAQVYINALLQPAVAILKKCQSDPDFMKRLVESDPHKALSHLERLAKALPVVVNVERLARGEPINISEIEATLTDTTGARDVASAVIEDEETAAFANGLIERLYRAS